MASGNKVRKNKNKETPTTGDVKIIRYLRTPMFMTLALLIMSAYAFYLDVFIGCVLGIVTVAYFVIAVVVYYYSKPRVMEAMVQFASDYTQVQKHLLEELNVPYGLIDSSGRILWFNNELKELANGQAISFKSISSIFEEITDNTYRFDGEKKTIKIKHNDKNFRVEFGKVDMVEAFQTSEALDGPSREQYLIAVYMFDETHTLMLEKENYENRMVTGLIYIDNYEEALQSVEEVRQSLLLALIDRRINKYFSAMDAVVRKLEKDKYFVAIKQKYVSQIQSTKFSILDDVKNVNIGNEMSITISIGMGISGNDYAKSCEFAAVAIDLALGRGGDQAVIKDGEKIYFYGGKSKQVEKNTRVKSRVKAHALRELIETKDKVFVMGHKIGDIDSFGASIGLYRACKAINKKVHIVINDITTSLKPMVDLFIENEEYEEDLFINSDRAKEIIDDNTALIIVDTSRPSRVECPELISKSKATVVLDHHRKSEDVIENASLSYIEPYASSACEMVAEILQYFSDGVKLKALEADAMYGGIMLDTNNFGSKTGVRTFEAAAFLRKNGADVTRVKKMFREDVVSYMIKAETVRNTQIFDDKFAIGICPSEGVDSPTIIGAQAANDLLEIKGIEASFVLTEYNDKIYISARSIDRINVQLIMEKLGGGGHMNMAGTQLENIMIEDAVELVKATVKQMMENDEI